MEPFFCPALDLAHGEAACDASWVVLCVLILVTSVSVPLASVVGTPCECASPAVF